MIVTRKITLFSFPSTLPIVKYYDLDTGTKSVKRVNVQEEIIRRSRETSTNELTVETKKDLMLCCQAGTAKMKRSGMGLKLWDLNLNNEISCFLFLIMYHFVKTSYVTIFFKLIYVE